MEIIRCDNVWKFFRHHTGPKLMRRHLKDLLFGAPVTKFEALKHVSFSVTNGEGVAIVGGNGAGKSTLLSLVAGLSYPDRGTVEVSGKVVGLLEVGSGFHPDLTGRENVFLNAALLGFSRRRTVEIFDSVAEFADIGNFIDEPLRVYSTGMMMRLAFSVAVHVETDILLIDEVLAVGDQAFQTKSFDRIRQLRRSGKTFFCVAHNRGLLEELCERAIWLDHGEIMMDGPIGQVFAAYDGHPARALP
jgi:ABC-type polysaccharide/polyol phosphate transport system ATPase subunit